MLKGSYSKVTIDDVGLSMITCKPLKCILNKHSMPHNSKFNVILLPKCNLNGGIKTKSHKNEYYALKEAFL